MNNLNTIINKITTNSYDKIQLKIYNKIFDTSHLEILNQINPTLHLNIHSKFINKLNHISKISSELYTKITTTKI